LIVDDFENTYFWVAKIDGLGNFCTTKISLLGNLTAL